MTIKRERFIQEYTTNGRNATRAAVAAGYSADGAEVQGSRLLADPNIAAAVAASTNDQIETLGLTAERTLAEVARIAFFDPAKLFEDDGSIKLMRDMDADSRAAIGGIEVMELFNGDGEQKHAYGLLKKIKLNDRIRALDMLMRYHALYKDKVEHTGDAIAITRVVRCDL